MNAMYLLVVMISAIASAEKAPLAPPSIGVSYSMLDLHSPNAMPASSLLSRLQINTAVADCRIPLTRSFEITISGGKVWGLVDAWNKYAVLDTVTSTGGGRIIGVFGHTGATPYRQRLDGLVFGASARWYLWQ
jgi:hypothetical protein